FARPRERGPVVAVGGVLGVGKTTLAAALSRRLRLPVVAEDGARRGLAGEGDPFSPAAGRRTCAEFLRRARAVLGSGRGVVLDGPFRTRASRGRARRLAERAGRGFLVVEVVCPAGVLRRRIRGHRPDSVGDLPERSWREFEAPGEVAAGERMRIESVEAPEAMAAAVEERLRGGVEVGGRP
ncbi:MAG: ATP-binding protein, partial [Planctomycetes bacterium]|nr:ATP-binding protein [Planctomycetota bacterium]